MSYILDELNKEQRAPAEAIEGAVLVTAGAGSGKTRMLTHRIAHLICDKHVFPSNILAITFTNKAANEMKERLEKMIGDIDGMWVCTFHAMCSRILRSHIEKLGYTKNFTIYGDVEKERLIKRLLGDKKDDVSLDTMVYHISNAKNHLLSPEEYEKMIPGNRHLKLIIEVYSNYEKEMQKCNSLDFDDLLVKTYVLLKQEAEIREYYQNKFKYIHVDEFQDTNEAQYKLVRILSEKYGNVLAVGDEDQCIYSWRGAEPSNVVDFTKDYAGCQIFKLEQNYRSTKKIIERANTLIKRNQNRLDKNLWTENSDGTTIEEYTGYNDMEEAEYVASTIKSLVTLSGYKYSDMAILMRVNALSRVLEEKLITYGVPYKIYGGYKFFERKEVKDTIAYLKLLSNPKDDDAMARVLAFPKKGIGEVAISNLRQAGEMFNLSMFEVINSGIGLTEKEFKKFSIVRDLFTELTALMQNISLTDFVTLLIKKVAIKEAIGNKTEEDINKQMNIDDFVQSVKEFEDANSGATLEDFLQSITLMRDIDTLDDEANFASMMTVHSAKGLEFKVVFIVGLTEGLFPLSRAIRANDPNELEEERRLMYVAITRAKERLYLTYPRTKFNFETKSLEYTSPSRFIKESKLDYNEELESSEIVRTKLNYNEMRASGYYYKQTPSAGTKVNILVPKQEDDKEKQTSSVSSGGALSKYKISDFKRGTKVKHPHFGEGEVIVEVTDFSGAYVTIRFNEVGIKTLSLKYANLEII
ncbi:MAG: UvrD-helicase domain-containing protein [Clostridia bacterium]|nr:UvrD-helicase domain-containing protein [Clostridia bacterium]